MGQKLGRELPLTENLTTVFKSPYKAKSETLISFLTTFIAFVVAYIFSIMPTDFLMANTCVHN